MPQQTYSIERTPKDDDELWWYVFALWGVKIPRIKVCHDHVAPFTAFADAYFARYPVSIWKASRGFGGKSFMLATLCLTEAVALRAQTTILGGSGAQSQMVHRGTKEAWAAPNAPTGLLEKEPTMFDTIFRNGAWIRSLTASPNAVRGPHPQRMRLDEIDEMDLDILEAAQGQPMRGRHGKKYEIETQTVMSSTHHHPDGTMTTQIKAAKEKGWPVQTWCWKETSNPIDGWLEQDEIARKRTEIPQARWEMEYDLQEPNFEGRIFSEGICDAVFLKEMGTFEGSLGKIVYPYGNKAIKPWTRNRSPYVTGVDWAKENDFTVIATFDTETRPWLCVAWERVHKLPWPVIVKRLDLRQTLYGGKVAHDNTGLGDVIHDYIADDTNVTGINLSGSVRSGMFSDYVAAVENNSVVYPMIEFAYDEHRYCTIDDLYGRGHPPDSMVAGSMAWSLRDQTVEFVPGESVLRESSPWSHAG